MKFPERRIAKIIPHDLVHEAPNKVSDLDSLFLTFGLIYNDIKSLQRMFRDFLEKYDQPTEVSAHAGEYFGSKLYLEKLVLSHSYEILKLLKENIEIIQSDEFARYVVGMSADSRNLWDVVLVLATGRHTVLSEKQQQILVLLERIRHGVTFHYYQAGKNLVAGFRHKFYEMPKNMENEYALYSLRLTEPEITRFFYVDAALEGYIAENVDDIGDRHKTYNEMIELGWMLSRCMCDLVGQYLETKTQR